jgi:hypothetical protein
MKREICYSLSSWQQTYETRDIFRRNYKKEWKVTGISWYNQLGKVKTSKDYCDYSYKLKLNVKLIIAKRQKEDSFFFSVRRRCHFVLIFWVHWKNIEYDRPTQV